MYVSPQVYVLSAQSTGPVMPKGVGHGEQGVKLVGNLPTDGCTQLSLHRKRNIYRPQHQTLGKPRSLWNLAKGISHSMWTATLNSRSNKEKEADKRKPAITVFMSFSYYVLIPFLPPLPSKQSKMKQNRDRLLLWVVFTKRHHWWKRPHVIQVLLVNF